MSGFSEAKALVKKLEGALQEAANISAEGKDMLARAQALDSKVGKASQELEARSKDLDKRAEAISAVEEPLRLAHEARALKQKTNNEKDEFEAYKQKEVQALKAKESSLNTLKNQIAIDNEVLSREQKALKEKEAAFDLKIKALGK